MLFVQWNMSKGADIFPSPRKHWLPFRSKGHRTFCGVFLVLIIQYESFELSVLPLWQTYGVCAVSARVIPYHLTMLLWEREIEKCRPGSLFGVSGYENSCMCSESMKLGKDKSINGMNSKNLYPSQITKIM